MATTIQAPLLGRSAIVTGGGRGIGAGIALDLAAKGCSAIAVTYVRNKAAADRVLSQIKSKLPDIKTAAIQADLLSPDFGRDVVSATLHELEIEKIDIVISNAAAAEQRDFAPIAIHTKEAFDLMMLQNVWSPIQLCLAALPHMPRGGRIVNISSIASKQAAFDPTVVYAASKSALDSATRSMAKIYAAERGVTFNTVSVGVTDTDAMKEFLSSHPELRKVAEQLPSAEKRIGAVDDVAQVVSFLCGEGSRWINGNSIPANGGVLPELQG